MQRSVWNDVVSWQTTRFITLQSNYSMHWWHTLQMKKKKNTCSQIFPKCLYLARIGRPDFLWSVSKLVRSITLWTKTCDKRLKDWFHIFTVRVNTNKIVMWAESLPVNSKIICRSSINFLLVIVSNVEPWNRFNTSISLKFFSWTSRKSQFWYNNFSGRNCSSRRNRGNIKDVRFYPINFWAVSLVTQLIFTKCHWLEHPNHLNTH